MKNKKPDIVYMGTPGFAVEPLKTLVENGYNIKAVVTATDKPAGRGCKTSVSEVKKYAKEAGLPVLQPEKLKDPEFIEKLREINADLFIVVAFRMLPAEVWKLPKLGTFNLHASLLPDYRGAAPINHAIINGETKTGITTFFINEDIDTGNIIFQKECEIEKDDNAGSLHDKLMYAGAKLVLKTVDEISAGTIKTIEQQNILNRNLNNAPKLNKEFCKLNFNSTCEAIHNLIRGLSPYPAAWFELTGSRETIKVFKSHFEQISHNKNAGELISDNKSYLKIACSDGFLFLDDLQMSGKKRMNVKDFLNGNKF